MLKSCKSNRLNQYNLLGQIIPDYSVLLRLHSKLSYGLNHNKARHGDSFFVAASPPLQSCSGWWVFWSIIQNFFIQKLPLTVNIRVHMMLVKGYFLGVKTIIILILCMQANVFPHAFMIMHRHFKNTVML